MGKAKKTAKKAAGPKQGGPYIAAAFFCDYCLEDKADGAISAIHIIDRINLVVPSTWTPTPENNLAILLRGLILIKSGDMTGDHEMRLVMHTPKRERHELMKASMPFEGNEQGVHIRFNANLSIRTDGLYWFDVLLSGKRLTRIPLQISIVKATTNETPAAQDQPATG
jgi:hypothetical protein